MEVRGGAQFVGQRLVPDASRFFPGEAADLHGGDVEGAVGDAGVDVDAAVVLEGVDVVFHVRGLRVFAQHGIVVGRPRRFHRADAGPVDVGSEQPLADDPVGLGGGLAALPLFDQRPEHVGEGFVQRARLGEVGQVGLVLGDAVRQLVTDHVEAGGEAVEQPLVGGQVLVAVAVDHLLAVPKGVVVALLVVDGGVERQAVVVNGIPPIGVEVQIVGEA